MVINPIVGVYIPIIRIPIKGGIFPIPNIATFDHGTNEVVAKLLLLYLLAGPLGVEHELRSWEYLKIP